VHHDERPIRCHPSIVKAAGVLCAGNFARRARTVFTRIGTPTARHIFHAHAHAAEERHDPERHDYAHSSGFPFRPLFVGSMHGTVGSAALILLTLEAVQSPAVGMMYIALFGIGSIAGMAALCVVIAVPLRRSALGLTELHSGL
jgi:hypothetical protein